MTDSEQWIRITDRPPAPNVNVIGYDRYYGNVDVCVWDGKSLDDEGIPILIFTGTQKDDCYITDWQPLPGPPKESS